MERKNGQNGNTYREKIHMNFRSKRDNRRKDGKEAKKRVER